MSDALYTIGEVASRSGLTAHAIRVWEKRYRAVAPLRTDTNRRLYSDKELERLTLLRLLTESGHSIGPIAGLPTERLRTLAEDARNPVPDAGLERRGSPLLDEAVDAVARLDARKLEDVLNRAAVQLGTHGLLQRLIAPLAHFIGELWRDGSITAAHEHFASAVIRIFLGHAAKSFVAAANAPVLVVATPHAQLHELGALLVGAAAANLGWSVTYLGASLPAAEIAGAARQTGARAVALSIVYPEDDPGLERELTTLRTLLANDIALLVGGRAAPSYREVLARIGAREIKDLAHLSATLDSLRQNSKTSRSRAE